jgi:hypothetical protein
MRPRHPGGRAAADRDASSYSGPGGLPGRPEGGSAVVAWSGLIRPPQLAEFFRKAQAESRKGAEQGKQLLRQRLGS